MKKITSYLFPLFLLSFALLSGCAHYITDFGALAGYSVKDLEKVKDKGIENVVNLSYDAAFSKMLAVSKDKNLTIYQENKEKKYIVVLNLPKQTDTTRIGIFFDIISANKTKITLSSLSTTALYRAEVILFSDLNK